MDANQSDFPFFRDQNDRKYHAGPGSYWFFPTGVQNNDAATAYAGNNVGVPGYEYALHHAATNQYSISRQVIDKDGKIWMESDKFRLVLKCKIPAKSQKDVHGNYYNVRGADVEILEKCWSR